MHAFSIVSHTVVIVTNGTDSFCYYCRLCCHDNVMLLVVLFWLLFVDNGGRGIGITTKCPVCFLLLFQAVLSRELYNMWEFLQHRSIRLPLNPAMEICGVDVKVQTFKVDMKFFFSLSRLLPSLYCPALKPHLITTV